jgi:DNA-binding transcriptional LysR family regulator
MGIDLTRLRYFVAVADELHFRRAADRLHITPPPLSKQIKLLERELGGALFEREYHEVRLTPLGRALLEPARRILDQVADLMATAGTIARSAVPLRVGATAYAPSDFLEAFEKALATLPSVTSEFTIPGSAAEVTAHLVAGHLDLGLIHLPATDPRVDHRVIARYRSCIAVRSDDPLAGRDSIAIEELRDREVATDFVRPNPALLAGLIHRLKAAGITKIVQASANGGGSEIEAAVQVRKKRLVMLLGYTPGSMLARIFSPPDFALVPIAESTWQASELALAWPREPGARRPELGPVVDQLVEVFAADRPAS